MTDRIKKCPFCGNKNDIKKQKIVNEEKGQIAHWLECGLCLAKGPITIKIIKDNNKLLSLSEIGKKWNRRSYDN